MKSRITLNTLRRIGTLEETMIRASMPRTAASDPEPLPAYAAPTTQEVVARRAESRLVRRVAPLTYTLAEVAHG